MAERKVIIISPNIFGKDSDSKTTKANEVAKSFGLSDATSAEVEDFKAQFTRHSAWDPPFMGCTNGDGYGYAYVPGAAVVYDPYWDAHQAFLALPEDVQAAFAIRVLFTHRPIDHYGANMFLHYRRGFSVKSEGIGANQY